MAKGRVDVICLQEFWHINEEYFASWEQWFTPPRSTFVVSVLTLVLSMQKSTFAYVGVFPRVCVYTGGLYAQKYVPVRGVGGLLVFYTGIFHAKGGTKQFVSCGLST